MLEIMLASAFKKLNEPGIEVDPEVFEELLASDGTVNEYFGWSVAVSANGLIFVVGANGDDNEKGADAGSTYIFIKQANGSYLQTQKLLASDGATGDRFGISVAISGDGSTLVIGAPRSLNKGAFYVFTKQADGSYSETQKLLATDGALNDYFGYSVTISGDGTSVVVSAPCVVILPWVDDQSAKSGSAYVYTKQLNGSYLQSQKLVAADGVDKDYFGISVAISGDGSTVVVGAYHDDNEKGADAGSTYIFIKQANENYLQTQKLVASDGAANDWFGGSVAISGDGSTVIVGEEADDDQGTNSGSAYIFNKQANGSYLQTQKLLASDGAGYDYFGANVTISGDGSIVVIGAYGDDRDKGTDFGSAYVFTKQANGSYLETHKLEAADGTTGSWFGRSVAVSNTSVVVGADGHLGKGAVYVY